MENCSSGWEEGSKYDCGSDSKCGSSKWLYKAHKVVVATRKIVTHKAIKAA